jgi:hypothetical protein
MAKRKTHRRRRRSVRGLSGLGSYPPATSPGEVKFNGKTFVCYGKPRRGGKLLPAEKMDVVVCAPKGTARARILNDSEVEKVKDEVRRRLLTGAQYAALRSARRAEASLYRKALAEQRSANQLKRKQIASAKTNQARAELKAGQAEDRRFNLKRIAARTLQKLRKGKK